jgi:hypothetical protein
MFVFPLVPFALLFPPSSLFFIWDSLLHLVWFCSWFPFFTFHFISLYFLMMLCSFFPCCCSGSGRQLRRTVQSTQATSFPLKTVLPCKFYDYCVAPLTAYGISPYRHYKKKNYSLCKEPEEEYSLSFTDPFSGLDPLYLPGLHRVHPFLLFISLRHDDMSKSGSSGKIRVMIRLIILHLRTLESSSRDTKWKVYFPSGSVVLLSISPLFSIILF